MSLRTKILLILVVVVVLYAGLDYGIQRLVVFPSFVALEQDEANKDLNRCFEAIRRESYHLDTFNHDWAAWDDTYQFVQDRNVEYISSNLVAQTFIDNRLNLIYLCDKKGQVVWGEIRNVETWQQMHLQAFPPLALPPEHPLLSHNSVGSAISGVFPTEFEPMLISSRPIVTTNSEGPIRGTLIMGRFLDEEYIETLVEQTRVDFHLWPVAGNALPVDERKVLDSLSRDGPLLISEDNGDLLRIYGTFPDIEGVPALLVRANIPREISARGNGALRFALFSILLAGIVVLVVLFVLLQKTVVAPIDKLRTHVVRIGKSDDLTTRLSLERQDEIGILAREFDRMVEQLSEARKQLLEKSYRSGIAEMASGILHNVRNSLTPMIVDIHILREEVRKMPIEKIQMALNELSVETVSVQRREKLIQFLDHASRHLAAFVEKLDNKLDNIARRAAHVEGILPERGDLSFQGKPIEEVQLDELLVDAMDLMPDDLRNFVRLKLDPSIKEKAPVKVHRISLRQVITNLLTNAAESIERTGATSGEVEIRAVTQQVDGVDMIHLTVCDDGEGIEEADLDRIFQRGFTTKRKGAWGIGLHWCANTMAAMKGRLFTESKGIGHGAVAMLKYKPEADKFYFQLMGRKLLPLTSYTHLLSRSLARQ